MALQAEKCNKTPEKNTEKKKKYIDNKQKENEAEEANIKEETLIRASTGVTCHKKGQLNICCYKTTQMMDFLTVRTNQKQMKKQKQRK